MSHLKELTKISIANELEKLRSNFRVSQATLIEIVRENYDSYVEMFGLLKAQRIGCYEYLVDYMAREFEVNTTVSALRATFHTVRMERGERVFKRSGQAFSNKHWDSGASVTRAAQGGPQEVQQNGQRLRYTSAGDTARSNPLPEAQVKRPGPVERLAASVVVPGGVQPGGLRIPSEAGIGEPQGVVWSLDSQCPVFQGVEFPIRAGKLVDKLRTLDGLIATVCQVGSDADCRSARTFLVGYLERVGFESYGQEVIEPMDWPQIAKQTLGRLQARI